MDLQLSGLRALVTGGTRGIGRAIVEAFLAEGTSVAFCARHADAVKATQDALSIDGTTVLGTALDVADARRAHGVGDQQSPRRWAASTSSSRTSAHSRSRTNRRTGPRRSRST